jgi:pimeloyl-ACP methyl ester carboxylesterase
MPPAFYQEELRRIASHGFIVVAPVRATVGPDDLKTALDWIIARNSDPGSVYLQKLSGKYAMAGHSLGSLATFDAEASETRLTTSLHVAGGTLERNGAARVKTPTAFICGEADIARPGCEADFDAAGDQPTFLTIVDGGEHVQVMKPALPAILGWLRWHLAGETERKAMFTGPSGEFFQGKWDSRTKNWR